MILPAELPGVLKSSFLWYCTVNRQNVAINHSLPNGPGFETKGLKRLPVANPLVVPEDTKARKCQLLFKKNIAALRPSLSLELKCF